MVIAINEIEIAFSPRPLGLRLAWGNGDGNNKGSGMPILVLRIPKLQSVSRNKKLFLQQGVGRKGGGVMLIGYHL